MKITVKDLDNILRESISNIEIQSQTNDNSDEIDSLSEPALSFLDNEEKQEKTKIQDFQRIKSVIVDPLEKKTKDNAIKQSQNKISQINTTRLNLMNNQENLKKQSIQNQQKLEKELTQLKKKSELLNQLRNRVQEVYDKNALPILKRAEFPNLEISNELEEQLNQAPQQMPQASSSQPKKQSFKVMFEKSSGSPFEVFFSERGFKIGETRLSFETVEDALSKNFIITLDGGNGIVLDAVRMQKILKYKNRFA